MIHLDTAIRFSFRPRDCRCQPDRRVLLETNSAECRPLASKQMRQDRRRSERDGGPDADISATPADLTPICLPFFRYLLQAIECLTDRLERRTCNNGVQVGNVAICRQLTPTGAKLVKQSGSVPAKLMTSFRADDDGVE